MAIETPLLLENPVEDSVDYKGRPAYRFNSGGWKSTVFIIVVEVAERSAYYGIAGNLIMYLIRAVAAAENINVWSGTSWLLPLFGAFVADSFVGRYRTIVVSMLIYILGPGLLALSSTVLPSLSSSGHPGLILFFFALYLVALGQGGFRPCVQAFGADQFDGQHPEERQAKSSFFNWWNFCMNAGSITIVPALNYIQDNINWGLGFGIPCLILAGALAIFLLGTKTYRYSIRKEEEHACLRVGREEEAHRAQPRQSSGQLKFLNKALIDPNDSKEDSNGL